MSKVTELATGQITAVDSLTVELVEADETPAVIIVRWPAKPTVLHPRRFPTTAEMAARILAAAVVKLAAIRRGAPAVTEAATPADLDGGLASHRLWNGPGPGRMQNPRRIGT